ncbi:MAG: CoA transferase [Burkholderiaceae bacterium]|nr:CoA transferase [Burkholderiaceae bacterium]
MLPLKGIRVLDVSRVLAGPLCTQTLGGLGAEVIKIESIGDGDELRQWPPLRGITGAPFLAYNRNKKSIALDLKRPEALELVVRLAGLSDVFVESGSAGATCRLGLGYEVLRKVRPDLVYCSISGFGQVGPLRRAKGYDLMLQAFSGMMAMTGEPGGDPVRSPFSPIDQGTGNQAVIGILSALMRKGQTGQGALVEVSLLETATQLMSYHLQSYWETGVVPARISTGHPSLVPYQTFETADRPILVGIANDRLWRAFCAEFSLGHIAADPRFATNPKRVENRAETVALVQGVLGSHHADDLIARLIDRGIPCSPINTLKELSQHEHLGALGMIAEYAHPELGSVKAVLQPITFDTRKEQTNVPPPMLGQHTLEVLALAGCSPQEIESYVRSGIAHVHRTEARESRR